MAQSVTLNQTSALKNLPNLEAELNKSRGRNSSAMSSQISKKMSDKIAKAK
jgi:hypothetical protein